MKAYKIVLIAALSMVAFGCKDSDRDKDNSINSCEDYGHGQAYSLNVFKMIHQAAFSAKGIANSNLADSTRLFGCDTMIVDTVSNPMTITIQFNSGCSNNSNIYNGEVVASFSSKYDNLGSQTTISFNNFSLNGRPISGSGRIVFNGIINGNPTYGYTTTDLTITDTTNNRMATYSGSHTITVTSGETTAVVADDNYSVSGSASGRAYAGNDFNVLIDKDLTVSGNCNWVSSGTATVSPENKQPRDLDFGSSCDNTANARIYGLVYEVVFPD